MRRAVGGCGTQAQAREVNTSTRRFRRAPDLGSGLNVELEGKEEKGNPMCLIPTTEEKDVTFEITEEKVIGVVGGSIFIK